ncbi:Hypothetical predicted protein [Marmota monax]|uniref:Aminotransferase class I/classII large domain-containing protein n=1 Tax=Marmota monax TaxID=9995 RepID=A0A5E4BSN6_MARMO|nr:Hypothetical predicted protein [Marmota monax]
MWAGGFWRAALSRAPCGCRSQSAVAQLRGILEGELEGIRAAGTWKSERIITSRQGPHIHVDGVSGGILNFCANNYLGLSSHPEVIQAGLQALEEFGAGLSSVRFICGTQSIHKSLEAKIARFHQREDAILYPSCFDANAGLFEALLTPEDAVLSDELNHASIIDGIRLCKAHKYRYSHLDMADLEAKLQEAQKHRLRLVATDGAFSMDGDIAPLQDICRLASQYGALVFVDECHATGFLGPTGRGTDELLGVMDQVTIVNSTLGKALGGASGAWRGVREVGGSRGQHSLYSRGDWAGLWALTNPTPLPCSQGATQQDLGLWCPCCGSGPGPTSSPTVCLLLWWAVPPRPWTCSWRATPLSSLWLPRPSGSALKWRLLASPSREPVTPSAL